MDFLARLVVLGGTLAPALALAESPLAEGASGAEAETTWRVAAAIAGGVLLVAAGTAGIVLRRMAMRPRLVVLTGAQAGNVIPLSGGLQRVGSLPENEIHLPSSGVSRCHAEITIDADGIRVRDLQSKNGTRINGVARELSPLFAGDRVEFGDVRVVFEKGPPSKERKSSLK